MTSLHSLLHCTTASFSTGGIRHPSVAHLAAILALDQGVLEVVRGNPDWNRLIGRQIALLGGVEFGPTGRVKASIIMAGIAAAVDPRVADLDDDALCNCWWKRAAAHSVCAPLAKNAPSDHNPAFD